MRDIGVFDKVLGKELPSLKRRGGRDTKKNAAKPRMMERTGWSRMTKHFGMRIRNFTSRCRSHPSSKRRRILFGCGVAALILLCTFPAPAAGQSSLQPEGWDAQMKLPEAIDANPDPH